jgi:hypothetical protein
MGVSSRVRMGWIVSRVIWVADGRFAAGLLLTAIGLVAAGGCQIGKQLESRRLIEHQALIDFSGLKSAETIESLKVHAAVPQAWEAMPPQKTALYTFGQWKSASGHTGVGVAYIRMPLPFNADTVLWFAKREYSKKAADGRIMGEWTDELGRSWFEAENNKYHVRGYALAQGFEAWIVFFGYKVNFPPDAGDIGLAARCADTFVPLVGSVQPATKPASDSAD